MKLTAKQTEVLLLVWPLIKQEPRPNCSRLLKHAAAANPKRWRHWSQLLHYMRMLTKHGVVMKKRQGNAVLWEPGPVSDYLQEQGVLS